jgi:hypothetical protein
MNEANEEFVATREVRDETAVGNEVTKGLYKER